jgi:Transglycosylase-like domain
MAVLSAAVCGLMLLTGSPASADPGAGAWLKLRRCESGNRYDLNTGNGEYGAYQFSLQTWRGLGGVGYPHRAAAGDQDSKALALWRRSGWRPWAGCARRCGLY